MRRNRIRSQGVRVALVVAVLATVSGLPTPTSAAPGDLTLASTSDAGTAKGNGGSDTPSLSDDGTFVAFVSAATNLDPGDTDTLQDVSFLATCSHAAGVVTCIFGSPIPSGGRDGARIRVRAPSTPGLISNTASVSASETDPVSGNDHDTQTTQGAEVGEAARSSEAVRARAPSSEEERR